MPSVLTCEEVRALIEPFLDSETDALTAASIERHLAGCETCREEVERIRALSNRIRLTATYHRAPKQLVDAISALGHQIGHANPSLLRRYRVGAPLAAVGLVAAGLVIGIFIGNGSHHRNELADALISGHERALASGHLMDVVSEDRHTVKPWFLGKLDFAPIVPDLSANGFPLLGGRLDFLEGHRAAVLVYGKGKHVIDLYVLPSREGAEAMKNSRTNGIEILSWETGGLRYCAVSDVADDDLKAFKGLVQAFQ